MAFRKIKAKKYNGVTEYYNPKSTDKETRALYISYRDEYSQAVKKKLHTLDKNEALVELNSMKANVTKLKRQFESGHREIQRSKNMKRLTLQQLAILYYDSRQTKENHNDKLKFAKRVIPILGTKLASKINHDDIQQLQNKLIAMKYAPKTVNETINALRALYNTAIRKKWVDHNPVDRYEIPKIDEEHEPGIVLSDDQLKIMFDAFSHGVPDLEISPKPKLFFLAKLLYHTGARPDAIINIQVQHCDFNQNKIHLKAMKKGKSYQQQVNTEIMKLISDWIVKHELKYGDYLFYPIQTFQRTNNPLSKKKSVNYSGIRRAGQRVFDKLFNVGIPTNAVMDRVSFYSLRRTSGTKIYQAKGIMHAMLFLNHTNVTTTQKYLNVKGDLADIVDVL
ncbi:MAG: tyrosine-type recombinase/integrase [Sulfurovum sp.]|nr:tyrosine-type recombinase/integrase [Sulfurovum sp.]